MLSTFMPQMLPAPQATPQAPALQLPPGTLAAQGFSPTPASPYTNRVTTMGRLGTIPQQPQPQPQPQPGMQPFAQRLAAQAQQGRGRGGFDFRRPTGPVSTAGANHRAVGFAASTPHRFSGTAFGGSNPRTASSVGSMSRLSPRVGMG